MKKMHPYRDLKEIFIGILKKISLIFLLKVEFVPWERTINPESWSEFEDLGILGIVNWWISAICFSKMLNFDLSSWCSTLSSRFSAFKTAFDNWILTLFLLVFLILKIMS